MGSFWGQNPLWVQQLGKDSSGERGKPGVLVKRVFNLERVVKFAYFVIASRDKRRGDPGSSKVSGFTPCAGHEGQGILSGFVANAPRNDDPVIYPS